MVITLIIITLRKLAVIKLLAQKPKMKHTIVSEIVNKPIEFEKPKSVSTPHATPKNIAGTSDSNTAMVSAKATKIHAVAPKISGNSDGVEPKTNRTRISRLYARYLKNFTLLIFGTRIIFNEDFALTCVVSDDSKVLDFSDVVVRFHYRIVR